MREEKIRLIRRCDNGDGWLTGKAATAGIISRTSPDDYRVMFPDGSIESICYEGAMRTVFGHLLEHLPPEKQHAWPVSTTAGTADARGQQQRKKERKKSMDGVGRPSAMRGTFPTHDDEDALCKYSNR